MPKESQRRDSNYKSSIDKKENKQFGPLRPASE
jgi:hypothetical protein